jgi:hypothetical protein
MTDFTSGREAALARRRALSAGKSALPPASERTRAGFREARLSDAGASPAPAPVQAASPAISAGPSSTLSGRQASVARRRMLAGGKAAMLAPPAPEAAVAPMQVITQDNAPRVVTSAAQRGLRGTGARFGGRQVTGGERGTQLPVSGTSYIAADTTAAPSGSVPKVGQARTERGLVVSGTLVRSAVRITGDERGDQSRITGKVDPLPSDDLTARPSGGASSAAQFQRQANPHGAGAFAANLGRSAGQVGSRQRGNAPAIEVTEAGAVITGSAVGRSGRVTGDLTGACRPVSGSQYLTPARREAACGGVGGGTAPAAQLGTARPDPVTGSKVAVSATWGGQRVTGIDVEHHKRVTGDLPGNCAPLTGSQYQGPATIDGYCGPDAAKTATARRMQARGRLALTGDIPAPSASVSGLDRGVGRDITGTAYTRTDQPAAPPADPVTALDAQFSIRSPQRAAQLRQARPEAGDSSPITGSFAVGGGKVTGNVEFNARPRAKASNDSKPAHLKVSGEGSSKGPAISGDSWTEQSRVTGTDGAFAANRNPTERGPKAKAFAGTTVFKAQAHHEQPKPLVTGMAGYFSASGARVTLSGGAQS